MEPEQTNTKVAVIGTGGDGIFRSLKRAPFLEQLIAQETQNMTTEDYFAAVSTLYRCISNIANSVASMPRQFEETTTGRVLTQANFTTPDIDESGNQLTERDLPIKIRMNRLLWQTAASLQLTATAFWHREYNDFYTTGAVWQDPRLIKPKYDDYGVKYFEKTVKGHHPIRVPTDEMVFFMIPGLREERPGVPPAQVAMNDAGLIYHQSEFLNRFFESGAMPTTLFFVDGAEPSEQEKSRIRDFLYRQITGRLRAWGIEILNRRLHFEHLVPPLKQMSLPELRTGAQYAICVATGVPISVIFTNASRNSTSEEDNLHYYTKAVIPLTRDIEETANEELFWPLGLNLRFRPEELEVFQAQEAAKLQNLTMVAGDLTRDERRAAAGYPPAPSDGSEPEPEPSPLPAPDEAKLLPFNLTEAEYELMARDLANWETKVLKRYGRVPPASIRFQSEFIPAPVADLVRSQLLHARNGQEVKVAFAAPFRLFPGSPGSRRFNATR